jgi:aldose 1-epimerase
MKGMIGAALATAVLFASAAEEAAPAAAPVQKTFFGKTAAGAAVELYTLTNRHGIEAGIMTYGGTLVSLKTPDRNGKLADIVLGFDTLDPYLADGSYFGAVVGRYANRIAGGSFALDGKRYQLPLNGGPNTLHGGPNGFDKQVWTAKPFEDAQGPGLKLTLVSPDGDAGFPGRLTVSVVYRLTGDDALSIAYSAVTTAPTPVNLLNHSYFNLSGDRDRPVLDDVLTIDAERFTPADRTMIPTGELRKVEGTPFDFRKPAAVGARIDAGDEQIALGHGYDHNWVLTKRGAGALGLAATLSDPFSGRVLEVRTTEPGLQVYTGNFLNGRPAAEGGSVFKRRTGLCLETQHFPDSPNQPTFPSTILRPDEIFTSRTVYSFRVMK